MTVEINDRVVFRGHLTTSRPTVFCIDNHVANISAPGVPACVPIYRPSGLKDATDKVCSSSMPTCLCVLVQSSDCSFVPGQVTEDRHADPFCFVFLWFFPTVFCLSRSKSVFDFLCQCHSQDKVRREKFNVLSTLTISQFGRPNGKQTT